MKESFDSKHRTCDTPLLTKIAYIQYEDEEKWEENQEKEFDDYKSDK